MNILITGATGYLGGNIATALYEYGDDIRIPTRREIAELPGFLLDSSTAQKWNPLDDQSINEIVAGIDAIVHLASPNELESQKNPGIALVDTALATHYLLEAAIAVGVKRFIYFSTIHVYGSPLVGTIAETTPPVPQHPYAIAHRAAEDYVVSATLRGRIRGTVIRLSNAIGAPAFSQSDRWTLLVNDLCRQAVTTGKMCLRSPGLDYRDFVAMQDVTCLTRWLLNNEIVSAPIVNFGSGKSLQVKEMAKVIATQAESVLGRQITLEIPSTAPVAAPLFFELNIDKILNAGFEHEGNLELEIRQTLKYCETHYGRE